jgi:hypothetical protein
MADPGRVMLDAVEHFNRTGDMVKLMELRGEPLAEALFYMRALVKRVCDQTGISPEPLTPFRLVLAALDRFQR